MTTVKVPCGISAIFEPHIYADPILTGARGAGVAAADCVEVKLYVHPSDKLTICNVVNGKIMRDGIGHVSVRTFFEILGIESNYKVFIEQHVLAPISAGFGTSAASSLGILLCLARELKIDLSLVQIGDIAHVAEIRARTGLGTISGLVFPGDIVIVLKHGAPSNCLIDRIILEHQDIYVVFASKGRIETSKALSDPKLVERASIVGKLAMDKLMRAPSMSNFFEVAHWFSRELGLMTKTINECINNLKNLCLGAAQAMIGDSIFALAYKEDVPEVRKIIEDFMKTKTFVAPLVRSGFSFKSK